MNLHRFMLVLVAIGVALIGMVAPAGSQTIALNLALEDAAAVDAKLAVESVEIAGGVVKVTGTLSGAVSVAGVSGTIPTQRLTLTAAATCKAGTGTVIVNTPAITANLANGTQATVGAATLTVSATCGRTPTLTVAASPARVTVTDGTTVSTTQCAVTVSSRANTALGANICAIQTLICELAKETTDGDPSQLVALLDEILSSTLEIA